jgi:hypothetical protein
MVTYKVIITPHPHRIRSEYEKAPGNLTMQGPRKVNNVKIWEQFSLSSYPYYGRVREGGGGYLVQKNLEVRTHTNIYNLSTLDQS